MFSALPPPRHQTRPIGNEYLQVRAEVGTALFTLGALAAETDAPAATLRTIQGLQVGLREPLRFVVIGEPQAGKSSLLNALFGREFCRTDGLSAEDCTQVFKYGEPARDVIVSPGLVERFQPIPFLRDFNVVDTPGINALVAEHQLPTETFLPQSDLVLFVFSAENPWSGGAWEILDRLPPQWLKNVVLVLQQADLREPGEIDIIIQHLRQTALQRFGQTLPVFAVSAKKALLAKTSGLDKERLWLESRFKELETYVNNTLGAQGENARRSKLRSVAGIARTLLKELATEVRAEARATAEDRAQWTRLRESMTTWKKASRAQVQGLWRGLGGAIGRCGAEGEHELARRLRPGPALRLAALGRDRAWEAVFQRDEETRLRAALHAEVEQALGSLEEAMRQAAAQTEDALGTNFRPAAARAKLAAPDRDLTPAERHARLSEKIELAMVERLADDQSERQLGSLLGRMGASLRLPIGAGVVALAAAAATLGFQHRVLLDALAVAAAAVAVGGMFRAASQRGRVLVGYRSRWEGKRQEMSNAVGDVVLQAIDEFYRGLTERIAPLGGFIAAQEERLRPVLERIDALERQFVKVAARL